jgi:hypothetical protein
MIVGTIEIRQHENVYFIPMDIYLTHDYPDSMPICYVVALENMGIVHNHKYVDNAGKCYLPYLSNVSATNQI